MRCVTGHTTLSLERCMLVSKWPLLIRMTLNACGVGARGQSSLSQLETAMRVMAVATSHCTFEHFRVERLIKIGLNFTMAANT